MPQQEQLCSILSKTKLSLDDFEAIASMKNTRSLSFLPKSKFPKHAFQLLAGLERLQFMHFDNSRLSNDDLRDIAGIKSLTRIDLKNCPIKDKMLPPLTELPKLKDLWLTNTKITDKGLAHVAQMTGLEWLMLEDAKVTDRGMVHLAANHNLKTLWLNNTKVTDKGLLELKTLTKLTAINIKNSKISDQGLEQLFAAQQEQLKIGRKLPTNSDPRELVAARSVLLDFFDAMKEWEETCEREYPPENKDGYMAPGAYETFVAKQKESCRKIFETYCTDKKRSYGRPDNFSYQSPTEYDRSKHEILDVEQETRSRIVSYTKEDDHRYRFVLLKKEGKWLVDHRKIWIDGWSAKNL